MLNTDTMGTPGIPHARDPLLSLPYQMDKKPTLKTNLEPLHGRELESATLSSVEVLNHLIHLPMSEA